MVKIRVKGGPKGHFGIESLSNGKNSAKFNPGRFLAMAPRGKFAQTFEILQAIDCAEFVEKENIVYNFPFG